MAKERRRAGPLRPRSGQVRRNRRRGRQRYASKPVSKHGLKSRVADSGFAEEVQIRHPAPKGAVDQKGRLILTACGIAKAIP